MNRSILVVFSIFAVGCSAGEDTPAPASVVSDSSGVRITVSTMAGAALWILGEPSVSVGTVEGEDPYVFDRVAGALRLDDGGLVVADYGSMEVRFFDSLGAHVATMGGRGGGPGEFADIASLSRYGDSVMLFDRAARRATIYSQDGALGRVVTARTTDPSMAPTITASTGSGTFVASAMIAAAPPRDNYAVWRDTMAIGVIPSSGTGFRVVRRLPGSDRYVLQNDNGSVSSNNHPLGVLPSVSAIGTDILYAEGGEFKVDRMSTDGRLLASYRVDVDRTRVTDDVVSGLRREWEDFSDEPSWASIVRDLFDNLEMPELLPSVSRVLVGRSGRIWVRGFTALSSESATWYVMSSDGQLQGRLNLSQGMRLTDAGRDWVVVVVRDELGVESVQLRPLLTASSEAAR